MAALLYAGCYAAVKAGLAYAPPLRFAALRALLGGIVLMFILASTGRPLIPARRLWLLVVVLALVGPIIGFAAMFASPLHTGAGLASVVGNTGPLLIIILAAVFLDEPITGGKIAAVAVSMAGVTLIAWPGAGSQASWHSMAVALPLIAAMSGASESVIVKRVRVGGDAVSVAGWQFLVAALPLFVLSRLFEEGRTITWSGSFLLLLVFLAAGATAAATALWYALIQQAEVSRLSLMLFLVPVAGLALGWMLFAEQILPLQIAGVALVLTGIGAAAFLRLGARHNTPTL